MSLKALTPFVPVSMTSAQRDAIPAGRRPKGAMIFNTTTNRLEMNFGTDASPIWLNANGPIDIQTIRGTVEAYSSAFSGTTDIFIDASNRLQITYTPPVNVWWEVIFQLAILQKTDANYHYCYGLSIISPADVDGVTSAMALITQHSTVQQYEARNATRIFKLAAGTAYTVKGQIQPQGGTWQYYQGANHMWLNTKAWPR